MDLQLLLCTGRRQFCNIHISTVTLVVVSSCINREPKFSSLKDPPSRWSRAAFFFLLIVPHSLALRSPPPFPELERVQLLLLLLGPSRCCGPTPGAAGKLPGMELAGP